MLFERKWLLTVLFLLVLTYLASIPGRSPDIDDAWIGEHAYWLNEAGYVKSELMRGITDQEDYLIISHKLLVLHGAAFIELFGFSLYSLKSVSLIYFIIFLFIFYYYAVRIRKILSFNEWLFSMILFFSFPWIFKYSFLFRPEIMIMTFAFTSFIFLENYLKKGRGSAVYLIPAGLVSGLAVATHLNGVVVTGAGFLLLLLNRKWTGSIIFGIFSVVTISIYFFDFNADYSFSWWYYQFSSNPALDSINGIPAYLQPLVNLLKEHQRFFHNPKIIIFSALLIVTLFVGGKRIWKDYPRLSLFTLLLFILTAMTAVHKSRQYMLVYFPFLVIMISKVFSWMHQRDISKFKVGSQKTISILLYALIIIFIGGSAYYNFQLTLNKFNPVANEQITNKYLGQENLEGTNIIAPMTFIFNEIEDLGRIHGEVCYTELQKEDPGIYGSGFLKKANDFDIEFIYLTPYYRHQLGMDDYEEGKSLSGWTVETNDNSGIYLLRNPSNN